MTFEEFVKKNGYKLPDNVLASYKKIEKLLDDGQDVFVCMPRFSCKTIFYSYLKAKEKMMQNTLANTNVESVEKIERVENTKIVYEEYWKDDWLCYKPRCGNCNRLLTYEDSFCPRCGAKLEWEDDK